MAWFQFQTGAIRRGDLGYLWGTTKICFNSKLVRLEGYEYRKRHSVRKVSIPNWCD